MNSKRLEKTEHRERSTENRNPMSLQHPAPRTRFSSNTNRRGFIFIYAYLLIVLFMVYELALLTYFAQNINAFERFSNNTIAYQLAEAGLDSAMAKLKNNEIVFDANGNYTETRDFILGNYNVTVSNQQEDLDGDGALDGPLAPNTFRITTLASAPAVSNPARPIQQATNVVAYVRKEENPLFEYAVFTSDEMSITNPFIRSYDSRKGEQPFDPLTAGSNGDIGTDSIESDRIEAKTSCTTGLQCMDYANTGGIYGDVIVGPGGTPSQVIETTGPNSYVALRGGTSSANTLKNYQPYTTNIPSMGHFNCSGSCKLPAGKYHFDSFTINGSLPVGDLTVTGPVEIYVDGAVRIHGNTRINPASPPRNFLLYVTGNDSVRIGSAASYNSFSGAIYAPNSDIYASVHTRIVGAVVGKTFFMNVGLGYTSYIAFDEALKDIGGGGNAEMKLVSWRTVPIESNSTESE